MGCLDEPGLKVFRETIHDEKWTLETVLSVHYWTPTLFSFRTTRHGDFRFTPEHYARLGLESSSASLVWRPVSLVSAASDEVLEFLVVLIPGGEFSEALGRLKSGDAIRVEKLTFGFMTVDQLAAGRDLWLLASGTGLGPFMSILRNPATWSSFEDLIVFHSVRRAAELTYREEISALARVHELIGEKAKLTYLPVVTREPGAVALASRIPQLLADGVLERTVGMALCVKTSRLMVCGNPKMAQGVRELLSGRGFSTSRRNAPGQMAFENYWHSRGD
jgi:ferredoxin--NADP+ reductase